MHAGQLQNSTMPTIKRSVSYHAEAAALFKFYMHTNSSQQKWDCVCDININIWMQRLIEQTSNYTSSEERHIALSLNITCCVFGSTSDTNWIHVHNLLSNFSYIFVGFDTKLMRIVYARPGYLVYIGFATVSWKTVSSVSYFCMSGR